MMSNRALSLMFWLCLTAVILLLLSGNATATNSAQLRSADPSVALANGTSVPRSPAAPASVGMSDLMSQTFEFTGAFPANWYVYDTFTHTFGTDVFSYTWSTTDYTRAEGLRSAVAVGMGNLPLTDTAVYTEPVDVWMVYGPVSLSSVWKAELDWKYLYPVAITSSTRLTVAVSTDYDPISRTGTFNGKALTPTASWTADMLDLSPYVGQSIYVAFRYQSLEGGRVTEGPFVDDVHLRANYQVLLPFISKWSLTLSKSASEYVWPGQSLVYTITVHNTDNVAADYSVTLKDTLPAGTTFASAEGNYSYSNGVVTWPDLTVPAGSSVVRHFTVTAPSSASFGSAIVNKDYSVAVSPMLLGGSPVTTTVIGSFFDDFTNPSSGWPVGDFDPNNISCWPPPGSWRAQYLSGGGYGVMTVCDRAAQLYPAPVRLADTRNFTVEADMRSNQADLWYSSYGIFFNGIESDLHEVYTVEFYQGKDPPEWDIRYWENFNWSDQINPPATTLVFDTCWSCNGQDYAWNHMLVKRMGDVIEVWLGPGIGRSNLTRVAVVNMGVASSSQYNRVGFLHANFEWRGNSGPTPYAYVFNNFGLTPAIR